MNSNTGFLNSTNFEYNHTLPNQENTQIENRPFINLYNQNTVKYPNQSNILNMSNSKFIVIII